MTQRWIWLAAVMIACTSLPLGPGARAEAPVLRISAGGSDVSTLDPYRTSATTDVVVINWIYNALVRFPPGSADPKAIEPDLAESWTVSADSRVWTFSLRKGVAFQGDWGELSADDVVYSLTRAADPARSIFASDFAGVESITKLDDSTVRITLKYPDASFLGRVANYHGGAITSRRAATELGDRFGTSPVGTGPFAVTEIVTQQYVKLVAHTRYFRGTPKIGSIMYRMIPSDSARELAFSSGELDAIYARREQRWVDSARRRGGMIVDIFRPGEFRTLHLNRAVAPLGDVRVREAIAHAINVDDLVRFVGKDVGPRGCSVVPPGYAGEDCSAGAYAYDPTRAKALLAEAGLKDGFKISATVSNISAQLPIMEVIQAQLGKVGIQLEMNVVDHPTYQSQIRKDASALVFYGAARFPIADTYLTEFYHSKSIVGTPTGVTNFSHCAVADAQIETARSEPDPTKQLTLWREAQRKIHDDVCAVPLFDLQQVWAHHANLDFGYTLTGSLNLGPPITEATTLTVK